MHEKNGMLTTSSISDFDSTKKAAYYDKESHLVADKANRNKLKKPIKLEDTKNAISQRSN